MRICAGRFLRAKKSSHNDNEVENVLENVLKHCAEVYFTSSGFLLFHCILCENEQLTDITELCKHLTTEHQNVIPKIKSTESTVNTEEADSPKPINCGADYIHFSEDIQTESETEEIGPYYVEDNVTCEETDDIKYDSDENDNSDFLPIVAYSFSTVEDKELNTSFEQAEDEKPLKKCSEPTSKDECFNLVPDRRAGPRIKSDLIDRPFKCEFCGLAFKEAYNLRQHVKRHSKAQRFKCFQCSKYFHTRTELETHERRHRGEFPYMCAECGKRFITSGSLNQHMRRHRNLRLYECDYCHKRFYDTSQLKHHTIVHTRERIHTCEVCNATFPRRKSMVTHMKIHANKREYICQICGSGFNQAPGLRMHLRNKHKDVITVQEMFKKENDETSQTQEANISNV